MSKFLDAIGARSTGHRRADTWDPLDFSITDVKEKGTCRLHYIVEATWKTDIYIEPFSIDSLSEMLAIQKQRLRYAIYSDLYDLIFQLEQALIERNSENAESVLRQIKQETGLK